MRNIVKTFSKALGNKLRSNSGESLTETLVALLISALAIAMLAGAVATSSRIVQTSRDKLAKYYSANEVLVDMPIDVPTGLKDVADIVTSGRSITFKKEGGSQNAGNIYFYDNKAFENNIVTGYKAK